MGGYHQLPVTPYEPQQNNPVDQLARITQLKTALQGQQVQQNQIQAGQQENQLRQQQLDERKTLMDTSKEIDWTQPDAFNKFVTNAQQSGKVSPQTLSQMAMQRAQFTEASAKATTEQRKAQGETNNAILGRFDAMDPSDPTTIQRQAQAIVDQNLQAHDPKLDSAIQAMAQGKYVPDKDTLKMLSAGIQDHNTVLANLKTQAETNQADQKANLDRMEAVSKGSPLTAMEMNPAEMAGDKLPAAMAYLKSKIADPAADPKDVVRATRLLSTAKTAQGIQLQMDASKKATDQAIQDGDPNAAARLLIDGTVAPSQLISSRKPEFAQKAFSAAQKLNPTWSAQKAEADFKVAGSPANVAFFGSAKSLTDKGGTLDQLADAAKDIPGGKIPVFNKVADVMQAATGSGPVAKYAAILLGVADDYSKVMGGGQGSDTSRTQALQLAPTSASPEARKAAIEGIRGSVNSQTNSRIGNNPVLRKMYGDNTAGSAAGTTSPAATHRFNPTTGQIEEIR